MSSVSESPISDRDAQVRDLLENSNDLVQSAAPDGRIVYVNRRWRETLGYGEDELSGMTVFDVVHPDDRERFRTFFEELLEGAEGSIDVDFVASDGGRIAVSGEVNCRFEGGEPVATRGFFRDVTDEKRAREELRIQTAYFEELFESSPEAVVVLDPDDIVQRINGEFTGIFGYAPDEVVGRDINDLIVPSGRAEEARRLTRRAGEEGKRVRYETVRQRKDGSLVHVSILATPIRAGGEGGTEVYGIYRDISDRKRAEEELRRAKEAAEEASRAKSRFLAKMSHELRTPLNSVIGFANILLKNDARNLTGQQLTFLDRILENGKHLLNLTNDVLDLSKIEAGRLELHSEPVDVAALVRQTLDQLQSQVHDTAVELRQEVPDAVAPIEVDREKLRQVLINLVGNALKFTDEGHVTVRIDADPGDGSPRRIDVVDTGVGIAPESLEGIFDTFRQGESGPARGYGGTGLGLAISRSLCDLLGFGLEVESEVGVGSTFSIVLGDGGERPSTAASGAPGEPPAREAEAGTSAGPTPAAVTGRRALVIDDEVDARFLLTHHLEELGCEVVSAGSGRSGLEIARELRPRLITLDLRMPEMDGWEVLRKIKTDPALASTPVVVVSIVAGEGRGSVLGVLDILSKPVDRDDLLDVVRRNLPAAERGPVLIVDDEDRIRELFGEILGREGIETAEARNGAEALAVLDSLEPALILLDLIMPEMDGPTFLQRLRQSPDHAHVPVVVVTGKHLSRRDIVRLRTGAEALLKKGANLEEELKGVVRELLGRAGGYRP